MAINRLAELPQYPAVKPMSDLLILYRHIVEKSLTPAQEYQANHLVIDFSPNNIKGIHLVFDKNLQQWMEEQYIRVTKEGVQTQSKQYRYIWIEDEVKKITCLDGQ